MKQYGFNPWKNTTNYQDMFIFDLKMRQINQIFSYIFNSPFERDQVGCGDSNSWVQNKVDFIKMNVIQGN